MTREIREAKRALKECFPVICALEERHISACFYTHINVLILNICGVGVRVDLCISSIHSALLAEKELCKNEKRKMRAVAHLASLTEARLRDLYQMNIQLAPITPTHDGMQQMISKMMIVRRTLPLPIGHAVCSHLL